MEQEKLQSINDQLEAPASCDDDLFRIDSPKSERIFLQVEEIPLTLKNFYEHFKDQLTESDCEENDFEERQVIDFPSVFEKENLEKQKLKKRENNSKIKCENSLAKRRSKQQRRALGSRASTNIQRSFVCPRCYQVFPQKNFLDTHSASQCNRHLCFIHRQNALNQNAAGTKSSL